jgi:hypothetical protein
MRKFSVQDLSSSQRAMTVIADYVTRSSYGSDVLLKFWVRRKWWQRDALVGTYETKFYSQCTSEEIHSDTDFLAKVGVQS